jgi:hypothetical protein
LNADHDSPIGTFNLIFDFIEPSRATSADSPSFVILMDVKNGFLDLPAYAYG